jgi:hypothetical protein
MKLKLRSDSSSYTPATVWCILRRPICSDNADSHSIESHPCLYGVGGMMSQSEASELGGLAKLGVAGLIKLVGESESDDFALSGGPWRPAFLRSSARPALPSKPPATDMLHSTHDTIALRHPVDVPLLIDTQI